jgi:Ca2+-transporting ATPase
MLENETLKPWHAMRTQEVFGALNVEATGLTQEEAMKRLAQFGPNELREEKKKSPIRLLLEQFKNILVIILLIATALSFAVHEPYDAIVIIVIIVAVAVLGFTQEYRAERALEALKKMTAPTALVLRDGREIKIETKDIVPGDILLLYTGDKVSADARLIEVMNLKADEAALTGESAPVSKEIVPVPEETPISERSNSVFAGTTIAYGRGRALVTSTGMSTEFGKIAKMVQATEEGKTPLEKRMANVGKWLGILSISVCAIVAVLGISRQHEILEMILWGVSLAVAAVPEALPAVVTGALAVGMYRMAKQHAIVRKLPAVETLGATSVICSDKTGTMTKGEMTVQGLYVDRRLVKVTGVGYEPKGEFLLGDKSLNTFDGTDLKTLLRIATLCNDAKLENEEGKWVVKGDSTEGALIVAAAKAGLQKEELEKTEPRVAEVPFSSERKRMTTIHEIHGNARVAYMKGAPEVMLNYCNRILRDGKARKLTVEDREGLQKAEDEMATQALRNLGFAYRDLPEPTPSFDDGIERDFVFVGLMGMIDPPREEVKDAIDMCAGAGIRVVMITGDHKLTAVAVAKALNLIDEKETQSRVLTGGELDKMDDQQLAERVENAAVYARVSPEHKMRIVKAWKAKGHVVAMTGDGVNDAPALKIADIGVAMGITGTEVTKEASDMILADDNFATIVKAVREGREIYGNIKKYLTYLLQCNIMEILVLSIVMLISSEPKSAVALTTIQILWVNLATDGLPAIALGIDPGDPDLMKNKPRDPNESVFSREVKGFLALSPIITTTLLLIGYFNYQPWLGDQNLIAARTQLFTAMVLVELAIAISCRSLKYPVFKVGIFKNKFLWIAVLSSLGAQLAVLYIPQLHGLFDVTYPGIWHWTTALGFMVITFASIEIWKHVTSRRREQERR